MFTPVDVALLLLEKLSFEELQKLWTTAKWVGANTMWPPLPPGSPTPSFRGRMRELTNLRPWRASRALSRAEMEWLGKVEVRTELQFGKRPLKTHFPRFDASEVWMINGDDRAIVGPNGEFWLLARDQWRGEQFGPPAQAEQQWMPFAEMLVPAYVLIPAADETDPTDAASELVLPRRLLHRENAPAVRDSAGYELWMRHGIPHRTDGPAIVRPARAAAMRELWFFRGTYVPGGQAELDELARTAPPSPMFDGQYDAVPPLPKGILVPALPVSAAPLPSYPPPMPEPDEIFRANSTLDRLMKVNLPVKSLEFSASVDESGGETTYILKFAPRKPLCDVVREDLAAFQFAPVTEAYFADLRAAAASARGARNDLVAGNRSFENFAVWGFPRAALVGGAHIVQVTVNDVGQARIKVDTEDEDEDEDEEAAAPVEWNVVDEFGAPWVAPSVEEEV